MTTTVEELVGEDAVPAAPSVAGFGAAAAVTSLGAGAIHAAAVGTHAEHRQAVVAFTLVAVFQIGWGALALVRRSRGLMLVGAIGNLAVLGGWVLAKVDGIAFIDGLEASERVQLADGLAAGLAAISVVTAALALRRGVGPAGPDRARLANLGAAVLITAMVGMLAAGSHSHAGEGHEHSEATEAGATGATGAAATGAGGAAVAAAADDHHSADATGATADHHADAAAGAVTELDEPPAVVEPAPQAVAPKPYVPSQPIDLGGVAGVTPEQQARAENLVAITLLRLPQWADPTTAEAAGFRSIRDGATGHEHYINQDFLDDGRILDPDHPESLVYDTTGPTKRLVSVMFMLEPGATLDTVPDVGGALTQWHIHDNLCFTPDPEAPIVAGVTDLNGNCPAPLVKVTSVPMIHVWIVEHPCGPFAALEGIAAGTIKPGETRLCDHAHGSG